mmetsp:Transcript_26780/g.67284  ORF Transcript_26780/g.67284 Transcript_26780/m.67284 type:complete len:383 (+) Transcript_26780:77-1225(+)
MGRTAGDGLQCTQGCSEQVGDLACVRSKPQVGVGDGHFTGLYRSGTILMQHKFELRCDAKGLCCIMTSEKRQSMVDLWAFEVSTLDFDVSFTPGDQLTLADALSRLRTDLAERDAEVDLDSREKAQERLPEERMHYNKKRGKTRVLSAVTGSRVVLAGGEDSRVAATVGDGAEQVRLRSELVDVEDSDPSLVSRKARAFENALRDRFNKRVPMRRDRLMIVRRYHEMNHQGSENLFQQLFTGGHIWPTMRADCREVARSCAQCLKHNVQRVGYAPCRAIMSLAPMKEVIDLAGPFPVDQYGQKFSIVFCDRFSSYVVLRAVKTNDKNEVARRFMEILCEVGLPEQVTSDNGGELVNGVMATMKEYCGFKHVNTSAYHPEANG